MVSYDEARERVDYLRQINETQRGVRNRIRSILNGGADAIREVFGKQIRELNDLPAPNMIYNAVERTAQKLGNQPDVKIDPPLSQKSSKPRKAAEKRERIINYYDEAARMSMQLPQMGRWLPAYGFGVWVIREGVTEDGFRYPQAELRDPFDCYPGHWGPNQQPTELGIIRRVNPRALARVYPQHADKLKGLDKTRRGGVLLRSHDANWEGKDGVEVITYYNDEEQVVIVPEVELMLDRQENVISSPHFVVAKRFAFDMLTGSYDQLVGIYTHIAKGNMLELMAMEDAVQTETNVIGEMLSGDYKRGRHAINILEPGSRVERPTASVPFQLFQHLDRLERQFRLGANYPVTDDGQSPTAFATGRAVQELGGANTNLVKEYQVVLADSLEQLDAKRLEWDEKAYGGTTKPLILHHKGRATTEKYDPREIRGRYRTRRKYGVMAGFDEPSKIVTMLQLLQGELIDKRTAQDNLDNLENVTAVNTGIRQDKAERVLFTGLEAMASQGDPTATMAMVQILDNPDKAVEVLKKFFTPEEPQISPEEEALAAQGLGGGEQGPSPDVTTLLSRLTLDGNTQGGVQTVGTL